MTKNEQEHLRHICRIARLARNEQGEIAATGKRPTIAQLNRCCDRLEEIENSARALLASCLSPVEG